MKRLPTLKQLEYLAALADLGHFGRAAERCHVTPSTLSAGIQDLERVLGVRLAERSRRHVLITPIGQAIAVRARELLRDAEDIMSLAASDRAPLSGDLRLGAIPTVGPFLLPRVLVKLRKQFPDLRLFLEEGLTHVLLNQLQAGELDAIVAALPYDLDGCECQILFEDAFQFACHADHPLAKQDSVSVPALSDEPLMLLEEGHCLRAQAIEVCKLQGAWGRNRFEASSFHTLVQMVGAGVGVTLLPQLAIDAGIIAGMEIRLVPLAEPSRRQVALVWRQGSPRREEFSMLGAAIRGLTAGANTEASA